MDTVALKRIRRGLGRGVDFLGLRSSVDFLKYSRQERRHSVVGDGPLSLWKMKRDFQINFLRSMNLKPDRYLLDIGCGTLRGGIPIISFLEVGHYFGVELRDRVLEEGRKELRECGLEDKEPTLLTCSDLSKLVIDQKFDVIWAFSVLMHMTDDVLHGALDFVRGHLADRGVFYANVNLAADRWEGIWKGFPIIRESMGFYTQACASSGLVAVNLGPLKNHGHDSGIEGHDIQRMLRITGAQ